MSISQGDTVFACATGNIPAALAVIRVSGTDAYLALSRFTRFSDELPPERQACYTRFTDPATGEILDTGLVIRFAAPASYTGEDTVEWQIHGAPANVRRCLNALADTPGFRMAEPGEFSRRALYAGKANLYELEGLADLLAADTEAQARYAALHMSGGLTGGYLRCREKLIEAMALIEAYIDFPEEDDVPAGVIRGAEAAAQPVREVIEKALSGAARGRRMREGVNAALFGAPNAGKSTVMNALAAADIAIVSDIPGTTRDALRARLEIQGYPVNLIDTAGIRNSADSIEQEGVARAKAAVADAHIAVAVIDASAGCGEEIKALLCDDTLILCNKADLLNGARPSYHDKAEHLYFSAKQAPEAAARMFEEAVSRRLAGLFAGYGEATVTRERHRLHLENAAQALALFAPAAQPPEIAAEYLRIAAFHIGALAGFTDNEDVLDVLFREFCIGK